MGSTVSLVRELEDAVSGGPPEKRVETLRRVTGFFLKEADRLSEQQIGVFDDVLLHLIQRIETKAIAQLSETLAPVANAPVRVIRHLSRHDEITIAGPVLTQSKRLSESDLIEIAKSKSQAHLLAISGRNSLTRGVTDILVERGDRQVTRRLTTNSSALISDSGFARLVRHAETDEILAEKLGLRLDIPPALLHRLIQKATDAVRARLASSATPENQERIQRALASIVKEVSQEASAPRDFAHSDSRVHELNRNGKLNEAALLRFARDRKYEEMTSTLALFCQVPVASMEFLMKNISHEGVVIACRAAKLSWPTVSAILHSRFAHHLIPEQELAAAKNAFLSLSQPTAQRTIRFMLAQHNARRLEL